jgi:hypothetical protein
MEADLRTYVYHPNGSPRLLLGIQVSNAAVKYSGQIGPAKFSVGSLTLSSQVRKEAKK